MGRGRSDHVLATVVFTDIVDSSRFARELGDRRWRVLLTRHHAIVRKAIKRHQGREIDNAGDGFFAYFTDQVDAIRCACQVSDDVRSLGIEVRAGCHVGQAEVLGKKLGGVTVHAGARVMAQAGPSEVLVSSMVKDLVPASGFTFADRGVHELKGIEGTWHLFSVTAVDGTARQGRPAPEEAARLREEIEAPPLRNRRSGRIAVGALAVVIVAGAAILIANRPRPIAIVPDSLVQIDPNTDKIVADVPVTNPDGAQLTYVPPTKEIWVLSQENQVISVVDTRTHAVRPIPVSAGESTPAANGYGIVYAFGRVYVTGGDNGLEWIDPRDPTRKHERRIPGCPSVLAADISHVWAAMTCTDRVAAIDPKSLGVVETSDLNATGTGIATGEGSVWTASPTSGSVARVDPASGKVTPIPLSFPDRLGGDANGVPSRITTAFEHVWVADNPNGVVYRIDPETDGYNVIHIGGFDAILGSGIASADGSIWVTSAGRKEIVRIDPATTKVQDRIQLPYAPNGLAVGDGSIWVTVNPHSQ